MVGKKFASEASKKIFPSPTQAGCRKKNSHSGWVQQLVVEVG